MGIEMQISMNDPVHSFVIIDTDVTTCRLKTVQCFQGYQLA